MTSILVVDDSKFMAKCMRQGLEGLGFDVVGVGHDGVEGFSLHKQLNPDVMLLDITMPNMDGYDCLIQVRKANPNARVIMLSALKDEETIQKCLEAGACSYLTKPVRFTDPEDVQRLRDAVDTALGQAAGK